MGGHSDICQALLEKKAEVNCTNQDGETPLMMAAAEGHKDVVTCLIVASADPDAVDKNAMTAIKKASRWGRTDCVKELMTKGSSSIEPRQIKHCLLFGRHHGHDEIVAEMKKVLEPSDETEAPAVEDAEGAVVPT